MPVTQDSVTSILRVLADETRLRILAVLSKAELSVGEIARALAVGQSRVSNHLKILRDYDLITERHEGSFTFCRLVVPDGPVGELWRALEPSLDELEHADADQRRLHVILAERADSRSFFDRVAGDWDLIGSDFGDGSGRLTALTALVPNDLVVADVGCGTGYMAAAAARRVGRVICVDSSPAMLERAAENLDGLEADAAFRLGSLEALPLQDGEVDAVFAHMVLHHLADIRPGIAEMARAVKPGGLVVCVEMLPHKERWMEQTMADVHMGLEPGEVEDDLREAGLRDVQREMLTDTYNVEHPSGRMIRLPMFMVRARRPVDSLTNSDSFPSNQEDEP